ncbi:hypothetical protein HBI70_159430 [Parastagonospora nodorum]|nr:hypothetical protein HBH54_085580 [Parastagonospora nodorum]KAH3947615.1 hypothetical protein HBH53_112850 [Parastagonospora nodorum]KAH4084160.1 hypothetical protein HBH48_165530 [Parastagonospora nodorum]KAH4171608.1 hypothetical protein HBH44_023600 [Parastagonospora nodorum]KAH4183979.1 hypothetical protein HBH42_196110 [Parastagonospora nodorum]
MAEEGLPKSQVISSTMGGRFSKAVRSHVKDEPSVAPTTSNHHDIDINKRQDPAQQLPVRNLAESRATFRSLLSRDDINLATCTLPYMDSRRRRYSDPPQSISHTHFSDTSTSALQRMASFEQYLAEHQLMNIDYNDEAAPASPAPSGPAPPLADPVPQCLICCTDIPKDGNKDSLRPCRSCSHIYCADCVKNMFIDACKDSTRMPPRCCVPINLQYAKPYLTKEEVAHFRAKYEEWCTADPIYCPMPTCSAFIPDRLLPEHVRTNKKRRVDSGVGTPTPESFACPTCEAGICTGCRHQAHPDSICNLNEFGLDADTAELLKKWGYKKCPKCGHGVKRMFGCNHMECRCGAHFCWVCLENINNCDGGCYDDEDEDEEEDEDRSEPDEEVPHPVSADETSTESSMADVAVRPGLESTEATTLPQPTRQRNLDGGGSRYWAESSFNFGEEPQDDGQEAIWSCHHSFEPFKVPFANAITSHTTDLECVKCWSIINPMISAPVTSATPKKTGPPGFTVRAARHGVRRGVDRPHLRGRGRGRGAYAPPRGLFRADATIGTAPHLRAVLPPASPSIPARDVVPMEDVQFTQHTVDSTFSPTRTQPPHQSSTNAMPRHTKAAFTSPNPPSVLNHRPSPSGLAHECEYCFIVVCETCKDADVATREAESARRQKEYDEREAREEEVRRATLQSEDRESVGEHVPTPASTLLDLRPAYTQSVSVALEGDQSAGRSLLLTDLGLPENSGVEV